MEIYYTITIVNRNKAETFQELCRELNISATCTKYGKGTATSEHLSLHDLERTDKAIIESIVTASTSKQLFKAAKYKMNIDIPGNGVMMTIPIKSVCGGKNLAYLTDKQDIGGGEPVMEFKNELIIVIMNEGYSDTVMDVARAQGARGGTVLHARGTGKNVSEKFFGISLAEEKDMIYILSSAKEKGNLMEAISKNCGMNTPCCAICFSLPVSQVAGLRLLDED
ncbi:MAG: P-II family nitrogen regulator [Bacteroidaceae bacterium]|nr:P-II family nitrogen regulator [Bacteroidaceae bacterium]